MKKKTDKVETLFDGLVQMPVLNVRMVDASKVIANDYNPNRVAQKELDLLILSIEADGVTQPIVTFHDKQADQYVIVDGFHRWRVLTEHFGCKQVPVVVIDKPIAQRMASTVRHNRARGKHQVDLQAELVKSLMQQGQDDQAICKALGMTGEELVRLKQLKGIACMFAAGEYSQSWEVVDG